MSARVAVTARRPSLRWLSGGAQARRRARTTVEGRQPYSELDSLLRAHRGQSRSRPCVGPLRRGPRKASSVRSNVHRTSSDDLVGSRDLRRGVDGEATVRIRIEGVHLRRKPERPPQPMLRGPGPVDHLDLGLYLTVPVARQRPLEQRMLVTEGVVQAAFPDADRLDEALWRRTRAAETPASPARRRRPRRIASALPRARP